MNYLLPDIRSADVFGKRVLLRLDLDVPIDGEVQDDTRLLTGLSTIEYLLKNGVTVVIAGHLGRPKGKITASLSLEPVAKWLYKKFRIQNSEFRIEKTKIGTFGGWKIKENLFLLENLRFYPEEEDNNPEFAKKLSTLADVYVNDAFAVCHRNHASIARVAQLIPHYAGFRLQEEIRILSSVLEAVKRPLVVIVGGSKIETKLPLISKMHHFADFVLAGGKIVEQTRDLLHVQHERLKGVKSALLVAELNSAHTDITPMSAENFVQIIKQAKTVVWNGPIGKIEDNNGQGGTEKIARAIIESKAYSLVGGGDTIAFLDKKRLLSQFSFVSTGGGAMLAFLSGEKLPGLEVLLR